MGARAASAVPSLIVLAVFVYGLIAWTIDLSLQNKHNALPSKGYVGLDNYTNLFTNDISDRFVHSLQEPGHLHAGVHRRHAS